jgi:hypothetical protein
MIQNPPAEWPTGVETADERQRASEHERLKVKCAFGVAIAALITLIVTLAIGAHEWSGVQDAAAVIGPVAGVTGTIVGGYLGHQAGSAGRERDAAEHREQARVALCLAALAEPTAAAAILGIDPGCEPRTPRDPPTRPSFG